MNNIKISSYGYLFNAVKNNFPIVKTIHNFCLFFDEVICVTIPSEDNTRQILDQLEKVYDNLKVIDYEIDLNNNRFDGILKTVAMNHCSNEIRVICDYDELMVQSQRPLWNKYADLLLDHNNIDGFYIPVVDFYSDKSKIRADKPIGMKFRMHKKSVVARGVIANAELDNGFINTDLSDSTEPLLADGSLARFASIITNPSVLEPRNTDLLNNYPFVCHNGYLNLENKFNLNRDFWDEKWSQRAGREIKMSSSIEELQKVPVLSHNLILE